MIKDRQIKLIIGSLLHDIGKVVYRSGDGRNHSQSGYEFLKNETDVQDQDILNCVRYHHAKYLKNANIPKNDCAYVTYFADNIAAFSDRRESEEQENGFDKTIPLDSVFNILNGNKGRSHYAMQVLDPQSEINYPTTDEIKMNDYFYRKVIQNITDNLLGIEISEDYLNSLLSVLEANLTYVPSSTSKKELADISLYDHVKMTAAMASCVEQYLETAQETDYRSRLYINAKKAYKEEMFMLYSMDISGIQNFIYTINSKGALKGLRARSFYLEIMMEHMVDELLETLSLSRANLIYTGGGHCYMLLPNTDKVKKLVQENESKVNKWLLDNFGTALYVAGGFATASANVLKNEPKGSYSSLYVEVSRRISSKKSHRYDADTIRSLNRKSHDGERECSICRRIGKLVDDKCQICNALEKMSGGILHNKYFTIMCEPVKNALPLPVDRYLVADTEDSLLQRMQKDTYIRSYTKNDMYTGKHVATKLWVGDYNTGETFEELAEQSAGVKRIGVLRADVDNLGMTFVHGFEGKDGDDKYVTLSRTATLSRQLSLFFKCYINKILDNGSAGSLGKGGGRKVVIVYSGGDDVFLAGAWNDVIAAFCDIRNALTQFTQGTLTISGGIGVYHAGEPINVMAEEVARLEQASKDTDGKNAVTIFSKEQNYPWNVLLDKILKEKLQVIQQYFGQTDDHGMAFLYHLTDLLRNTEEQINVARYVYLLSRMEPDTRKSPEQRAAYRAFSKKMYEWGQNEVDRRELITAIYLYVYLHREENAL